MNSRIELQCSECGEKFTRQPSQIRGKLNFCKAKCFFEYQSKKPNGKNNPEPKKIAVCVSCRKNFKSPAKENRSFCSKHCYRNHQRQNNFIKKDCSACGKSFETVLSKSGKKCCSAECYATIETKVEAICQRCGKAFIVHGNKKKHCSEVCRRPVYTINCLECCKEFRIMPYQKDSKRFCSTRCYRKFTGETEPEKNVREILEENKIHFQQEFKVEGWRYPVDFYLPDFNLMLEVDEPYWHSRTRERDARKTAFLQSKGYKVVRIDATPFYNKVVDGNRNLLVQVISSAN